MQEPQYRENLPEGCPLPESCHDNKILFRLVSKKEYVDDDYYSQAIKKPGKRAKRSARSLCRFHSVSLFGTVEDCKKIKKTLGSGYIAKIEVTPDSGKLFKAKPPSEHYDWWPYKLYPINEHVLEYLEFSNHETENIDRDRRNSI
ncbi:hypothetical protein F3D14_26615 [Bacteroides ovatus]|nr:hypothetical protein F3D14_26615 [Bacteroides ovatus]